MKNQPTLIDPSGSKLPGPQFQSRPGWGGNKGVRLAVRLVILVLVIWGITALFRSGSNDLASSPTPTPTDKELGSYSQTAKAGEGLSYLAARALDAYLADNSDIKLAPIEHAWAVNRLVNTMLSFSSKQYPANPKAGEVIAFPDTAIEYAIAEGKSLTPSQRRNLQGSLR